MAVRYNKLFKRMIDIKMTNAQLIKEAGISANIVSRLKKDEYVSLESLEKICRAVDANINEIIEFTEQDEVTPA